MFIPSGVIAPSCANAGANVAFVTICSGILVSSSVTDVSFVTLNEPLVFPSAIVSLTRDLVVNPSYANTFTNAIVDIPTVVAIIANAGIDIITIFEYIFDSIKRIVIYSIY